jgi:hypothetical protein
VFEMDPLCSFFSGVGSSLTASLVGLALGYLVRDKVFKKKLNSSVEKYVESMGNIIDKAINDGKDKAIINGRAIISIRNELRDDSVIKLSLLNSDIDKLAEMLNEESIKITMDNIKGDARKEVSESEVFEIFKVLKVKWHIKKSQLENLIKKNLQELGLYKLI